jgi:putative SOS response-associated peptidase YedK
MVEQNAKKLGLKYKARIQPESFETALSQRNEGVAIKIPYAFDHYLITQAESPLEKKLKLLSEEHFKKQIAEWEAELNKQKARGEEAEKKLRVKVTKAAEENKRIATAKIDTLHRKIKKYQELKISESDSRVFPKMHAPLLISVNGSLEIALARYLYRPPDKSEEFDKSHDGLYNARQDSLLEIKFWRDALGEHHGVLPLTKFYENVDRGRNGKAVICFEPRGGGEVLAPALYSHVKNKTEDFLSFAIITGEPNPEVLAAGHERTPLALTEEGLDPWVSAHGLDDQKAMNLLGAKKTFFFEHEEVSAW